jgi:hypothetical protein
MIIRHGAIGTGKTHTLVHAAKDDPKGIIVCFCSNEAKRVMEVYDLPREKVVVYNDVRSLRGRDVNIYIDNLDVMLKWMFGAKIISASSLEPVEVINMNKCTCGEDGGEPSLPHKSFCPKYGE